MSLFEIRTADDNPNPQVLADDELAALTLAVDAGVLADDAEGNIESVPLPDVEDYEPEGPG